jgi:VWFA-related protein
MPPRLYAALRRSGRAAHPACIAHVRRAVSASTALLLPLLAFSGNPASPAARGGPQAQQNEKLRKPRELDKGVRWRRDPATGELNATFAPSPGQTESENVPELSRKLISVTNVVSIQCSVFASDGTPLRDLTSKNFRVYDDDIERPIAFFDAGSNQPARVAMVIDASPSVLRDADEMKRAAAALVDGLAPTDEVAVVDFSAHAYLQTGFTGVRELLRRAVDRVDVRQLLGDTGGSNIYEAVYLAAHELFPGVRGRKAIVLLTDGQDSGLGLTLDPASAAPRGPADNRLTFDDVARELEAEGIQLFAVSTEPRPKIMTRVWFAAHRNNTFLTRDARKAGIPAYSLFLAEIVRRSAGDLYFLHEADTLAATFSQIAQRVGSEYTLGVPPAPGGAVGADPYAPHPGWHRLRVETVDLGQATVIHRTSYFAPPNQ